MPSSNVSHRLPAARFFTLAAVLFAVLVRRTRDALRRAAIRPDTRLEFTWDLPPHAHRKVFGTVLFPVGWLAAAS